MRVLLVEDDLQIGQSLFRALKNAHYTVDWIRDGKSASVAIDSTSYAAVLLDIGQPGIGGIGLLRSLRAAGNRVPVMMLTSKDDIDTRVSSLDVGADDCVLKPIDVRELCARLRAVLRRRAGYATSRIGDDLLGLDLEKRTLHCNGIAASLSAREFALMHSFMEQPGAILSRGQLEDRIYGWGREVESNAVDVLIHSMRKRFGQSLIRNVRGMGWTVTTGHESKAA
ncbi:MAG TPA: response regulator transcription factor [Paraburkholderia sp.]|nr:response regulator transcription factor [Paraburkholderia sp.]